MFFNWSLMVSISARVRSKSLSQRRIRRFFMFLRILVVSLDSVDAYAQRTHNAAYLLNLLYLLLKIL